MSEEQRRKAESLSRAELVELAKYCGMEGASNNFESPYRNRKWICENLPASLFGPQKSTMSTYAKTRSIKSSTPKSFSTQKGGEESEGAKATMAAIASGSTGGTSGALAGLSQEIARRALITQGLLPELSQGTAVESISNIPADISLDLPLVPEIPSVHVPMEGEYVPGTGKRLKYCATKPPTLPLEIDESDPSYREIFEALYPPKIGTYAPLPEIPRVLPPTPSRPLPPIPEGPFPGLPETPEGPEGPEAPGGPAKWQLSEGAKATLIAMQNTPEPSPYGVLPLSPAPSAEPVPTQYVPIPGPSKSEYVPLPPIEPIVPEQPIPETLPIIPEAPLFPVPPPKKKKAKKQPPKATCPAGFDMDDKSGLCLEVMKTCPAVEGCKAELESLGLKQKEAEKLLDSVKEDLIACQSSSAGWKQIEADLKNINLTKEEADRILVSIGKHLSARIRAGESLDSLLDRIQKTLDQSAETVANLPPVAAQEFAIVTGTTVAPPPMPKAKTAKAKSTAPIATSKSTGKSTGSGKYETSPRPSTVELQEVKLKKVTPKEKKLTQLDLESTLQTAVLKNPAFIARAKAMEGKQDENQWAA